jgi:hypothetical protein
MWLELACPEGVPSCNDAAAISVLIPLFPIAALIALLLAWPLGAILPRRPVVGWPLASVGAAGYVVFAAGPLIPLAAACVLGVFGAALALGRRDSGMRSDPASRS